MGSNDNCSCTFFLGRKAGTRRTTSEIVSAYMGQKVYSHK